MITNILPGDTDDVDEEGLLKECRQALAECGEFDDVVLLRRNFAKNLRVLMRCASPEVKAKALEMEWVLIYRDGCYIVDPATYREDEKIKSEVGRVLQVGGYGQLLASHLTEFMQETNGKAVVVPPKHIDGKRGTVAYITYATRDEMLAAAEKPVKFNGRSNGQYFSDREKVPRKALERHRPNPKGGEAAAKEPWVYVMACYRCHSDQHVNSACPEKDEMYKPYMYQIDLVLRGGQVPKEKVPGLRRFIMQNEARETSILPQNEIAYKRIANSGIANVYWKQTSRAPEAPKVILKRTEAKGVPGNNPTNSYAKATGVTTANTGTTAPVHTENNDLISKLMERTAKLEKDVSNLTTIISSQAAVMQEMANGFKQQMTMMEEQTKQVADQQVMIKEQSKQVSAFMKKMDDGVGRPRQWLPAEMRAAIAPSEIDKLVQARCAKWAKEHFLGYSDTTAMHIRQIVGRGNIKKLEPWFKEVESHRTITEDIAAIAFEHLVQDYANQYGLGKWHALSEEDRDFECTQARTPRHTTKQQ